MNQQLLDELAGFLQDSNVRLQTPNITPVIIDECGVYVITVTSHVRTNFNDLADKHNIVLLLSFSALDALLNYWHSGLTSEGFKARLLALPTTTQLEKVIFNSYRIMMALRNALVHEKNGIDASATGVKLGEQTGNKKFVACSSKGIGALITIIYLLLKKPDLADKYSVTYLAALHDRLIIELGGSFRDNVSAPLGFIGNTLSFALGERKQFEYSLSSESEIAEIELNRYPKTLSKEEPKYRDQFLFRWNGNISVIPGEVLDKDGTFNAHHLVEWKIEPGCTLALT